MTDYLSSQDQIKILVNTQQRDVSDKITDKNNDGSTEIHHLEQSVSRDMGQEKDHMNYDRVDKEVAKYAGNSVIEVSVEDNKRLKRIVDKRVLSIMIFTYFLQALDKGTMSFASIMNIQKDTNLHGQQVNISRKDSCLFC